MRYLHLLIIGIVLGSCSAPFSNPDSNGWQEVSIDNQFAFVVPNFLDSTAELINPFASIQFTNYDEELYMMVIEDEKALLQKDYPEYDLEDYYQFVTKMFEKAAFDPPLAGEVNGMQCIQVWGVDALKNSEMFYKIAIIEGDEHFYQVITWTAEARKDEYSATLQQIIDSFHELETT